MSHGSKLPMKKEISSSQSGRSQSIHSTVSFDPSYENVNLQKLYEAILKVILLEYVCEARFYKPVMKTPHQKPNPASSRSSTDLRKSRLSRFEADSSLPAHLLGDLKRKLNSLAMKKSNLDDLTRRSLLRFYGELLDPHHTNEITRANSVDILVMKFVSTANKEVVKLGSIPPENQSVEVFRQANSFIDMIIKLVQRDKNSDVLVAKLEEHKASLRPKDASPSKTSKPHSGFMEIENAEMTKPSFDISDIDQSYISLLKVLFHVEAPQIQQDINRLKMFVSQKTLSKDLEQSLFYLERDIGRLSPNNFSGSSNYEAWKVREKSMCDSLLAKFPVPNALRLLSLPSLPDGDEYYIVPSKSYAKSYFVVLIKLCLQHHRISTQSDPEQLTSLFSNKSRDLIQSCARIWRIDIPTRAVCLFTAAHLSNILVDLLYVNTGNELGPISIEMTTSVLHTCKRMIEDADLDWDDKSTWSLLDQDEWVTNLSNSYSELFFGIKECLGSILNKTIRPKFGPYLSFLSEYIESDSLFDRLEKSALPAKWEKRLTRALLRTSELSYADILATLPRDDTATILHILDISEHLTDNIKLLQKRYKAPLLGFLDVSKTYASVVTDLFASDAKNILKHIIGHIEARGQFLNYNDALEVYKCLDEIRSIHQQTSKRTEFAFRLEEFFFPYLESWVSESTQKIREFVINALAEDMFEPIDIEDDEKKYSTSIHDIFTLIKHYLKILNALHWRDEHQRAKVFTTLMKSISSSCLLYADSISDSIMNDLNEAAAKNTRPESIQQQSGWLAEVKGLVNNIQLGGEKIEVESYNFTPRTCIGLNNINSMIKQLSNLENILKPEEVSSIMLEKDPASRHSYKSHIFSIRVARAEHLRSTSDSSTLRPYLTLIDTQARKTVAKTRTLDSANPEWDEEFEIIVAANTTITLSATVWEERFGSHGVCGRSLMQLEPRKFKHDGIPQEVYLDLDSEGRLLIEIAVESDRDDAIFAMGRAHRALNRSQQRIIKMIVAKFSKFIKRCFSRNTLKSVCGSSGNLKPTQDQMDEAMMPLYNYLNANLMVLAQYLTKDLLLSVMLEAWGVVVASADELLLPKLTSSRALKLLSSKAQFSDKNGWQSAVSSAVANVTNTLGQLGFGKTLTNNEIETVIGWLNFLCFDFFYNEGNGPPIHDLKIEQYQSLLLIPVYYDSDTQSLMNEVERLSPAYLQTLRDKNNVFTTAEDGLDKLRSRAGSIARSSTVRANATANARARAAKEAKELSFDPLTAQTSAENIILRLLLVRDEKSFVSRRLEQRERLAHTIATERLARAAAEGTLFR